MGIETTYLRQFVIFFAGCLVLLLLSTQRTLAANGVIAVSPQTGNYTNGKTFIVAVDIDGGGTAFNAAKATVIIPPALSVQDVTIGNCDFAFVKTPTQGDPSFVGVILGGSTKTCTVYTLTLKAINLGTVNITLFNVDLISYKGAQKIPLSVRYGRYNIAGAGPTIFTEPSPIEPPVSGIDGIKLYDIHFTFPLPKDIPTSALKVVLDPSLSQERTVVPISNPDNPTSATVTFEKVPEGVHTIAAFHNEKLLSKQIVNVTGNNKNLAFGVGAKKAAPTWIWYVLAITILLSLSILGVFLYRRYHKTTPQ